MLAGRGELKLLPGPGGKRFELRHGRLEAQVARQRPFRPLLIRTSNAEAQVLGTRFDLMTATNTTRLHVSQGKVRLTRASDRQAVTVSAGQSTHVAQEVELTVLPETGNILREIWTGLPGGEVNDLLDHPDYPNRPTQRDLLKNFEIPVIEATNYASRLIGYIHPPVTGEYTFWIASGAMLPFG
jgi:hypothetical protein